MDKKMETQSKTTEGNGKWSPFKINLVIGCTLLIAAIGFLVYYSMFFSNNSSAKHHSLDIQKVCELTTLECRYHNVAVVDEEGGMLGAKKRIIWLEFDGIIELGIDVKQVRIEEPTKQGVVKIYLPPAKILSCDKDESTISKPVYDVGLFSEFTGEDERELANTADREMKNDAQVNEAILSYAYENAKNILEQHVINAGKMIGKDYTVEWAVASEDIPSPEDNINTTTE